MRTRDVEALLDEPTPMSLSHWAWQTMIASLPYDEFFLAWGGILEYIGWLQGLPTTYERS